MRQKHPVFPKVPRTFWHRFRRRWSKPLEMLEEVISLGEALGTDSRSPRFESMNDAYWAAMRSLHARTCLHARGVLALLSNGLVDPAWPQWRVCHESSTIARFIAEKPEMAPRYLNYSYVNKYQMARELYEIESNQAPGNVELNNLKKLADRVQQDLEKDYGHSQSSRDYGWSGRRSFKDIEAEVSKGDAWNPRGEYRLSSERVHSASNAGEPFREDGGRLVFVVGPKNSGLTGPVDLTSIAITRATMALLLNASCSRQDLNKLRELSIKSRLPGALSWIVDPEIICTRCGGHVKGASPPELMPEEQRPKPCTCVKARRRRANRASPTRTRSAPGRSQEEDGC